MTKDSPNYGDRTWDGEPTTGEGITHATGVDLDADVVAACGVVLSADFPVPRAQLVTCVRCWARWIKYPKFVRW